ncbi:hypothetical protein SAMN02745121_02487 [Nannocystis exedens]|uniref:Uncharacterized protein n=1 Tax=Nannocystis exedens TaxID=54 RepID=A0A1I1WWV2_9BACT|nr:hypothetical protein [Nannocystis exedens]PCC71041.1 hypothetical protein NAEX_04111 [Nannocystis exedens]SFD97933.1 hypothetical protein SAMN02745121_02487 [Nannocystis exedens]
MKLPSKGVLIRICIYVPLLAFFGWRACEKYQEEQRIEQEQKAAPEIEGRKHTFTLPDGKSVEVVEISEDQARQLGFDPSKSGPPSKAEAPAKTADAEESKSPPPAPTPAN